MKQAFNSRIGAFVKYRTEKDGTTRITDVKQKNKKTPFVGVPFKKG